MSFHRGSSMRMLGFGVVLSSAVAGTLALHSAGCTDTADDCALNPLLECGPWAGSSSGTTSSSSSSGSQMSCDPTMGAVADACGAFVSSSLGSDATGKGTREAPYQTLAKALEAAGGKPVYACGETFTVTQTVTLSAKVDLYGALDCSKSWAYDATKKTQLQADATTAPIPLTLASGASGSSVHDFAIIAADAVAAGASSIAVLDDHADLTLRNVDVTAGKGAAGGGGAAQSQVTTPATAKAIDGTDDAACNVTINIPGGAGGTNTCNGTATNGGNGGKGLPASTGDDGLSGQPLMGSGNGGSGQTKTLACNVSDPRGAAGGVGTAGIGARGIGDISASGHQAPAALVGGGGTPGQGGGGGGGAHACDANSMFAGPSGGGGGAGGCGGAPGNAGTSGGSSIGILALGAKVTLTTVTITTKAGGMGGLGGDGQLGGNGGLGGQPGNSAACNGGKGGQGGAGGPGGGGAGGHSVGIASKGGTLPDLSHTTIAPGSAGLGGKGGDMDMTAQTKGDDGQACKTLDFTNPASPTACGK